MVKFYFEKKNYFFYILYRNENFSNIFFVIKFQYNPDDDDARRDASTCANVFADVWPQL